MEKKKRKMRDSGKPRSSSGARPIQKRSSTVGLPPPEAGEKGPDRGDFFWCRDKHKGEVTAEDHRVRSLEFGGLGKRVAGVGT